MRTKYKNGNRLAVPEVVKGKHFFYKTQAVKLDATMVNKVVQAAIKHVEVYGLNPAQIELLRHTQLEKQVKGAGAAFEDLLGCMGEGASGTNRAMSGILVCDWANPHIDEGFVDYAFLSVVLHTGPEPYIMQTFHTYVPTKGRRIQKVESSTRCLKVGDMFMFDPTTAHMVMPRKTGSEQLLVMLQVVLRDSNDNEREGLLKTYPPLDNDVDGDDVFEGQGC